MLSDNSKLYGVPSLKSVIDMCQRYYLNSQVNNPHEQKVSHLAYSPTNDMCVTTSWDGKFKIWATRDRSEVPATNGESKHWLDYYDHRYSCINYLKQVKDLVTRKSGIAAQWDFTATPATALECLLVLAASLKTVLSWPLLLRT